MAEKEVPYFSPAQRTTGALVGMVAATTSAFAANQLIPEYDLLPFIAVCLAPALLVLAVWRFCFARSSSRMTRSELQRRYAMDTLQGPYWQALLIHGAPAIATILVMLALQSRTASRMALLLVILLPIAYIIAATTLHFERQRARRLLGEIPTA